MCTADTLTPELVLRVTTVWYSTVFRRLKYIQIDICMYLEIREGRRVTGLNRGGVCGERRKH